MKAAIDEIWEEIHSSQSWGQYPSEYVIRFVARNYYNNTNRKSIKILDFGCGQGAITWYLSREGFDVYAFDGSESAVAKTREKLRIEGEKATLNVYDGTNIDYPDDFFDAIIDNACIYANRINDIVQMYKNVYRVLKPGGRLLTICFGEDLFGYKTGKMIEPGTYMDIKEGVLKDRGVSHIFSISSIESILSEVGFVNIKADWGKYTDDGRMVHHLMIKAQK